MICQFSTRRAPLLLVLAVAIAGAGLPGRAAAQPPASRSERVAVRVGKWVLLGAAIGFGTYALSHSNRADRAYGDLRELCATDAASCRISDGHYGAADAEALYRASVREDRRAQVGILGGQVTLLGSVALFVYDLRNGRGPANIPYPGATLDRSPPGVALGARLEF